MSNRIDLTLEILTSLGMPLVDAAIRVPLDKDGGDPAPDAEARVVASLLAHAVKLGMSLSGALNLNDDAGSDAVRLALTSLSARLVGTHYTKHNQPPEEAEVKRVVTALKAVLSFADNFSPDADTILRLQAADPSTFLADEKQVAIQYISVMVPVVDAVASYSFGRPEGKLVQEVGQTLTDEASRLRARFLAGVEGPLARRVELQLLQSLADLYVQCHEAEKERLARMDDKARAALQSGGALSMDHLWEAFRARTAMVADLAQVMLPDQPAAAMSTPAPQVREQQTPVPQAVEPQQSAEPVATSPLAGFVVKDKEEEPETASSADSVSETEESGDGEESAGAVNPMSFFAKKEDE